jgi:hypothetical protein
VKISNYAYRLDRLRPGNGVSEQQKRGSCADRQDDRQRSLGPRRGYQSDVRCARGAAIIALFWQVSRFEPPPAAPLQRPQERHGRSVGVPEDERLHEQRALPVDPRGLPSDRLWAHLHERAVDQIGQATDPRTRRRAASEAIPYRRPLDAPPLSERLARATSSSMAGAAANACVRERNGR